MRNLFPFHFPLFFRSLLRRSIKEKNEKYGKWKNRGNDFGLEKPLVHIFPLHHCRGRHEQRIPCILRCSSEYAYVIWPCYVHKKYK